MLILKAVFTPPVVVGRLSKNEVGSGGDHMTLVGKSLG